MRFSPMRALRVSSDGTYVGVVRRVNQNGDLLQVWDVAAGQLIHAIYEPLGVTAVAFAPESRSLAYGAGDASVILQPLPTGAASRWKSHRLTIGDLAFSPDGTQLASFGHDNRLIVWDVARATAIAEATDANARFALQVKFAGEDRLWTRSNDGLIRWYDFKAHTLVLSQEVKLPADALRVAAADDARLYGFQPGQSLLIVDAATGREIPGPTVGSADQLGGVTAIAVASASHDVAVCTTAGELTLWTGGDPARTKSWTLGTKLVVALAGDPNGRVWSICTAGGGLLVFDRDHPETPQWFEPEETGTFESSVAPRFSHDGTVVASLRDPQTVVLSEIASGLTRQRITRPHSGENSPVAMVTSLLPGRKAVVYCGTSAGAVEVLQTEQNASPSTVTVAQSAITALAESPDGQHLLVGAADGATIWIDPAQASRRKLHRAHAARIGAAEISASGRWGATGSDDTTVVLWNATTQSQHLTLRGHEYPVQSVAFSPDSGWLVSGDQRGHFILWEAPTGRQIWSATLRDALVQRRADPATGTEVWTPQAAFSEFFGPNFSGGVRDPQQADEAAEPSKTDSDMPVGDAQPASREMEDPAVSARGRGIVALAFSRDQRVLAVGTSSGYTQTFDLIGRRELSPVFHQSPIGDLVFSTDVASLLVATGAGDVTRWRRAPDPPRLLAAHRGRVHFAALDSTGRRAVTGGVDKTLRVWDVDQGALVEPFENDGEAVATGALSPDGRRAVTCGYGSGVVFWDLVAMARLGKRFGHAKRVHALAFSADGNTVASGGDDRTVRVWDFATQKTRHVISHDAAVRFIAFTPDGDKLLTATIDPRSWQFPARLRLWETSTGRSVMEFSGHRVAVTGAAFSADGRELTSCGADGQVCRWNTTSGELLSDTFRPNGLSHAGLVCGGQCLVMRRFNDGISVDHASSLARLAEIDVSTRAVSDLNVAGRGNRIIAGTEEGAVYVWSLNHE
ncbi:WD40 repeat domain-containing protein [Planctellipticum variicoloris]|uniref:WD40 repeat domain-containing protein n=1 Tax=Planctellipticum variicoloris TaxID=3064265 RepID=UPI0030133E8D|nr:WD40 repeat domain-containing protein [Planctomycetaceae bacterium SH412]